MISAMQQQPAAWLPAKQQQLQKEPSCLYLG
jgi:hypothetical protein